MSTQAKKSVFAASADDAYFRFHSVSIVQGTEYFLGLLKMFFPIKLYSVIVEVVRISERRRMTVGLNCEEMRDADVLGERLSC